MSFRTNHHLADLLEQRTTSVRVFGRNLFEEFKVSNCNEFISHIFNFFFGFFLKPGSLTICYDWRRSPIACRRSYGNIRHGVCGGRRPTICVIGRVELDSIFPTVTTTPTKKDLNGTVCGKRRHIIVPLKPRVSNCPMRIKKTFWCFLSLVPISSATIDDGYRSYRNASVWYLRLIDRRRSPTVTDNMETRL